VGLVLMTWVPLLDTGTTILRRLLSGVALFQPDRDHVHHRLLARGSGTRAVGRHLIGLNALGVVSGVLVHLGIHPAPLVSIMVVASLGVLRAAFPLRVTQPVERPMPENHRTEPHAGAQERAA
jgi:UDP-GlcNAc:undecaprenyl-phosphate GlcNAc-1-phosphate transferase